MSYFSNKLKEILEAEGLTQSDLSRTTRLSTAHISNLIHDVQPRVSLEDLENIANNISTDDQRRAELIRAHLLDECVGPGSKLIEIKISGGGSRVMAMHDQPAPPPMSPRKERALEIFRRHAEHAHLWDVLAPLADMMEVEPIASPAPTAHKPTTTPVSYKKKPPHAKGIKPVPEQDPEHAIAKVLPKRSKAA